MTPYVPSSPSHEAVLADIDTLSRALVERGAPPAPTDQWWITTNDPSAVAATVGGLARTDVGAELASGPLRAAAQAALWLLVATAILLASTGTAARELAVGHERALEVARLRGFGASRRLLDATGIVRHGFVTVLSVGIGVLGGALLARVLVAVMVTSRDGGPPCRPPPGCGRGPPRPRDRRAARELPARGARGGPFRDTARRCDRAEAGRRAMSHRGRGVRRGAVASPSLTSRGRAGRRGARWRCASPWWRWSRASRRSPPG